MYSLDGGGFQSSTSFNGVSQGNHTVTVKDGCTTATTAASSISVVAPPAVVISSLTSSLCNNSSNGQITVVASGGTGSLSYSRDGITFQSGNVLSGLVSGNYNIAVKDLNGCVATGNISVPFPVTAGTVSVLQPTCSGSSTGSVSITGSSSGTGALTWSIGGAFQPVASSFANVSPGTYSVTVHDANGCSALGGSITVNQPVIAGYSSTVASCAALNDGTITVTGATGGTGVFVYSLDGGVYQTGNSFSNVSGGTHSLTVKDGNNCVFAISASVGVKPAITGFITQTSLVNCFGQNTSAFNVIASGGTAPYQAYNWSNGASGAAVSNVGAGTYTVTITDSKNCAGTANIIVSQPPLLTASLSLSNYNGYSVSCKGGSTGSISSTPSGGTSSYSYSWSNGLVTQNISNLSSGSYSVIVHDAKGCVATASTTLTEPVKAVSTILQNKKDITCFGAANGQITVNGSGGVGALSYSFNGTTYQLCPVFSALGRVNYTVISWVDINCTESSSSVSISTPTALAISSIIKTNPHCAGVANGILAINASGGTGTLQYSSNGISFSSSPTLTLGAGSYVATIKDANSCTISSPVQVLIDPPVFSMSATGVAESYQFSNDGKINIVASGGTGSVTYSIDGITFQPSPAFTGLASGIYQAQARDANNCTKTVSVNVASAPPLPSSVICSGHPLSVRTTNVVDPICRLPTGSAQAVLSGASGTATYQWLDGLGHLVGSNAALQNVAAATYTVNVTDASGCAVGVSVTLSAYAVPHVAINNIGSASCSNSADGSAIVDVVSAHDPYSVLWSNGETAATASKLLAGKDSIAVTDANGCTTTASFLIPSPPVISLSSEEISNPVCAGGFGSIVVTPNGGSGNYRYSWNGTSGTNSLQNIGAGRYVLIITDSNGCTFTKTYSLIDPPKFTIDLGKTKTICPNSITQLGLTFPGAVYQWSGPNGYASTQGVIAVSDSGVYQLSVTDSVGCIASDRVTLQLSTSLLQDDFLDASKANVGDTIVVIDISWPVPDKIQWVFVDTTTIFYQDQDYALISYSKPGTYSVGVMSTLAGCEDMFFQSVIIEDRKPDEASQGTSDSDIKTFVVYPNPFSASTNLQIELSTVAEAAIKVYSLNANEQVMEYQFSGDSKYEATLDFSEKEEGLYIIVLYTGSTTKAIRIIKL